MKARPGVQQCYYYLIHYVSVVSLNLLAGSNLHLLPSLCHIFPYCLQGTQYFRESHIIANERGAAAYMRWILDLI